MTPRRTPPAARRAALATGLLGVALACAPAPAPPPARVTVDSTARYQRMTAWEATADAGQEFADYAEYRDRVIAAAADLGINRLRVEVRSGMEHRRDYWAEKRAGRLARPAFRCARYETANDDDDPRTLDTTGFRFTELDETVEALVLPLQRLLAARGERLSVNVTYIAFIRQCPDGADYVHADPAEYAEFVLATVLHLRRRFGIVPDLWEIILEPDHNPVWTGRRIGEAMVAASARLAEHGIPMRFIAPANTNASRAVRYFDEMAEVPGALSLLDEFAYHRYRGVSRPVLVAIGDRARRYGVRTAMLERIGADVEDLEEDLQLAQVSAWQQYVLTHPGDSTGPSTGGHYIAVTRARDGSVHVGLAPRARFLRQYFRHVRMGARRVAAASGRDNVHPVAFQNADGTWTVVIRTTRAESLEVAGLPAGTYAASWTTRDTAGTREGLAPGTDGFVRTGIPAAGVLTLTASPASQEPRP